MKTSGPEQKEDAIKETISSSRHRSNRCGAVMGRINALPSTSVLAGIVRHSFSAARGCLLLSLAGLCLSCLAEGFKVELKDFDRTDGTSARWTTWAPREEIKPRCFVDSVHFRSAPDALAICGNGNAAEYGGWVYPIENIKAGRYYRLTAYYRTESVQYEQRQVVARLTWFDQQGRQVGQADHAYETSVEGEWKRLMLRVPALDQAVRVNLELRLGWAPQGTVWWDDISFEETAPPAPRVIRVGSVSLRPRDTANKEANLNVFLQALDEIAKDRPDIVCLGEAIPVVGNSETSVGAAEEIPGPITSRLGERARQHRMYIVAGLFEREGQAVYNTAVLIDRQGNVVGKYRKVYLPREETDAGLTPGMAYPVFTTDFGKIGIMICWDAEYVDPARALAVQGAEIIFVPAAGGYLIQLQARALENHVYLVSSGYDVETAIINPQGEVLHATRESGVYKTIPIDLQERFMNPWLGDMRPRFHKEIRWDIPVAELADRHD
ncbi:MAG: carbon-nitrogen hydrolase family protein [Opitutaceae bacterium]|jgi:predicted amidohydrolase